MITLVAAAFPAAAANLLLQHSHSRTHTSTHKQTHTVSTDTAAKGDAAKKRGGDGEPLK